MDRPATNAAANSSTWTWHADYGLYFNPARALWAQYDASTGEYRYLPPAATLTTTAAATSRADNGGEKEEGELSDDGEPSAAPTYDDPSLYAFPSNDGAAAADNTQASSMGAQAWPQAFLRLVCLASSCLPAEQKLATLSSHQPDGYSLGRDRQVGAEEGRIRLREMEVSKTHAIIFYEPPEAGAEKVDEEDAGWGSAYLDRDAEDPLAPSVSVPLPSSSAKASKSRPQGKWAIVDLGSTHGTYVKSTKEGKGKGARLSESKVASLPRVLEHLDEVRVGGTTFQVHLHASLPCIECSLSSASALIPTSIHRDAPRDGSASPSSKGPAPLHDPFAGLTSKERLHRLRADMLKTPQRPPAKRAAQDDGELDGQSLEAVAYMDRAAARRAVHPSYPPVAGASGPTAAPVVVAPAQDARTPIPATNIGHSLLLKHGWAPGQALGREDEGRVEPLEVKRAASEGKRGLGMTSAGPPPMIGPPAGVEEKASWRDEGREKRWREMGLLK